MPKEDWNLPELADVRDEVRRFMDLTGVSARRLGEKVCDDHTFINRLLGTDSLPQYPRIQKLVQVLKTWDPSLD